MYYQKNIKKGKHTPYKKQRTSILVKLESPKEINLKAN